MQPAGASSFVTPAFAGMTVLTALPNPVPVLWEARMVTTSKGKEYSY